MRKWLEIAKSICNLRETDNFNGQKAVLLEIFGSNLAMQNKTLTTLNHQNKFGVGSKTAFRKGAESSFCLWQELKNLNQKITHLGDNLDLISNLAHFYEFARTYFSTKADNFSGEPRRASTAQTRKTDF